MNLFLPTVTLGKFLKTHTNRIQKSLHRQQNYVFQDARFVSSQIIRQQAFATQKYWHLSEMAGSVDNKQEDTAQVLQLE